MYKEVGRHKGDKNLSIYRGDLCRAIGSIAAALVCYNLGGYSSQSFEYHQAKSHEVNEKRIELFTSEVIGAPTSIACNTPNVIDQNPNAYGYVPLHRYGIPPLLSYDTPSSTIFLRDDICSDAASLLYEPASSGKVTAEQSIAVFTLFHEMEHIKGVRNEAAATCFALQSMPIKLTEHVRHIDAEDVQQVANYAYSFSKLLGSEYQSEECQPGGALDRGNLK